MPPRVPLCQFSRTCRPIIAKPNACSKLTLTLRQRHITSSEKPLPTKADQQPPGPNQSQLPHVSEEAADTAKVMDETAPEIEQQGTPVEEVLARSEGGKQSAPEVLKDETKESGLGENPSLSSNASSRGGKVPSGTRSYSTTARRRAQDLTIVPGEGQPIESTMPPGSHIFPLPQLPLPSHMHMKHRYDPLIEQMTNLLMRDGKKATAQRVWYFSFHYILAFVPFARHS